MTALATLARIARRQAEDLQRALAMLEERRRGCEAALVAHDETVLAEQRAAAGDAMALYGDFAQAALKRRAKLKMDIAAAQAEEEAARATLADAFIEQKKLDTLVENEALRAAAEANRLEQAQLDDVASVLHGRR